MNTELVPAVKISPKTGNPEIVYVKRKMYEKIINFLFPSATSAEEREILREYARSIRIINDSKQLQYEADKMKLRIEEEERKKVLEAERIKKLEEERKKPKDTYKIVAHYKMELFWPKKDRTVSPDDVNGYAIIVLEEDQTFHRRYRVTHCRRDDIGFLSEEEISNVVVPFVETTKEYLNCIRPWTDELINETELKTRNKKFILAKESSDGKN